MLTIINIIHLDLSIHLLSYFLLEIEIIKFSGYAKHL